MKIYNKIEKLAEAGVFYKDCNVGVWKEYYRNGKIKLIGHYKENQKEDWNDIECCIKHGKWTYYKRNGKIKKLENYLDGRLLN